MAEIRTSIPLAAPAGTVWEALADLDRIRDWLPGLTNVTVGGGNVPGAMRMIMMQTGEELIFVGQRVRKLDARELTLEISYVKFPFEAGDVVETIQVFDSSETECELDWVVKFESAEDDVKGLFDSVFEQAREGLQSAFGAPATA